MCKCLYACMRECVSCHICGDKGTVRINSLLLSFGAWGLNAGHQAWWKHLSLLSRLTRGSSTWFSVLLVCFLSWLDVKASSQRLDPFPFSHLFLHCVERRFSTAGVKWVARHLPFLHSSTEGGKHAGFVFRRCAPTMSLVFNLRTEDPRSTELSPS